MRNGMQCAGGDLFCYFLRAGKTRDRSRLRHGREILRDNPLETNDQERDIGCRTADIKKFQFFSNFPNGPEETNTGRLLLSLRKTNFPDRSARREPRRDSIRTQTRQKRPGPKFPDPPAGERTPPTGLPARSDNPERLFLPPKALQAQSLRVKHLRPRTPQQTNIRPLVFRAETDRDLTRKTVSGGCSCEHPPEIIRASGTTCLRPQPFPNAGDRRAAYCAQRRTRLIIVCMAFRIVSSEQYSNLPWKFMPPVNRLGHGKPI